MSVADAVPARRRPVARLLGALRTLVLGSLLCLAPVTSVIALGWLMRRMRFVALARAGLPAARPGWLLGHGGGIASRALGGLAANLRAGFSAALSLALATMPFASLWILSWWAGWENSFGKGYEQAWVGPTLGIAGVAVFCVTMIWLPMALAHQSVEDRALALFEWRRVRSAVRHAGWGYLALAVATVVLALPLFASRGLVAFASDIVPGFDTMTSGDIAALAANIALASAVYTFAALLVLRGWAARLYAVAVSRAANGPEAALWRMSPLARAQAIGRRPWRATHLARLAILPVIWFGLAAQIFVAQFLNHDWTAWLTHPLVFLPFAG